MFNTQNLTPKQLSALTAVVIAAFVAAGILIMTYSLKYGLGSFLLVFAGSYFLIQY
ncbi:MAG TPA: two-component sensor histidine kinase, partial [Chitinophagaceae bacterium]|nr:two-component sensor histidine kinase [Chitinophagaceae bacterium]